MNASRRPGSSGSKPSWDDWYRNDAWDAEAQAEFATRLARSRPHNQYQYRRIKGLALLESGDSSKQLAGQRMLEDVLEDPTAFGFDKAVSMDALSEYFHASGRLEEAEKHARAALSFVSSGPIRGSGAERVRLAEILLDQDEERHLVEARRLLDASPLAEVMFMNLGFRICLLGIRVSQLAGEPDEAREWAEGALAIAAAKHSGLRYHPDIGLVNPDEGTLRWLRDVAYKDPMKRPPARGRRPW